jgi:hypothetical protein
MLHECRDIANEIKGVSPRTTTRGAS